MSLWSLRLRLLLGAAVSVALALVVAGVALVYIYSKNVDPDLELDFNASVDRLTAMIQPERALSDFGDEVLSDPRYAVPLSGYYWQIEDLETGETARSRSLWDVVLTRPDLPSEEIVTVPGPEDQTLVAVSRLASFDTPAGQKSYRVTVAEDQKIFIDAIDDFRGSVAVALTILGLGLVAAAAIQVQLGLRPLERLQSDLAAMRRGSASRLEGRFPSEVQPLVAEVNELLEAREESIEFARARAGDLAHGIKTPLSVLQATAGRIREGGDAQNAQVIEDLAAEMLDRVDYQLRLSHLRLRTGSLTVTSSLNDALLRSVAVLKKTGHGEHLFWDVQFAAEVSVYIDSHDLVELVGNLLENAAKWAKSRVDVTTRRDGRLALLTIKDDGPGINEDQIKSLGRRGARLDESRAGSGLGLAIATEILTINGGAMTFVRSPEGGLQVEVHLPAADAQTVAR